MPISWRGRADSSASMIRPHAYAHGHPRSWEQHGSPCSVDRPRTRASIQGATAIDGPAGLPAGQPQTRALPDLAASVHSCRLRANHLSRATQTRPLGRRPGRPRVSFAPLATAQRHGDSIYIEQSPIRATVKAAYEHRQMNTLDEGCRTTNCARRFRDVARPRNGCAHDPSCPSSR